MSDGCSHRSGWNSDNTCRGCGRHASALFELLREETNLKYQKVIDRLQARIDELEAKGGAFLDAIDAEVADPNKPGAQKAADEARQAFRAALQDDAG